MAVISGPSVSLEQHARALAAPRSAWAVSWPLLLGLAVFVFLNNPTGLPLLADPDTHWHITVGNWILTHGSVPVADSYSYTFTGQPWIAKEWLSQVLLALAFNHRWLGRRDGIGRRRDRLRLRAAAALADARHPAGAGAAVHRNGPRR